MAAGTPILFIPAKRKLLIAGFNLATDSIKVALFTSALALIPDYLGASGDARYADISANEVANGNGYTTGGVTPGGQLVNYYVSAAAIAAAGGGGTNGAQTVTGTTGAGTKVQAAVTVAGNIITSVNSVSVPGAYTGLPTAPAVEPVTGGGLAGAQLNLTMGSYFTFTNPVWTASSFTAKWAVAYDNTAANKDLLAYWDLETTLGGGVTVINGTLQSTVGTIGLFSAL